MFLNPDNIKPIYVQIAEWLKTEILCENLKRDERVYSQYQLADMFNINPATAAKGLNILADENIVYKKRGLGMFVSLNAKQAILAKRKSLGLVNMVKELVAEAERLNISKKELLEIIINEIENNNESREIE